MKAKNNRLLSGTSLLRGSRIVALLVLATSSLLLAGCASRPDFVCRQEPRYIVLTPAQRTRDGITLVSISRSGRVTIRSGDRVQTASRAGESFVARNGRSYGFLSLHSADPDTGRVVVAGVTFALY